MLYFQRKPNKIITLISKIKLMWLLFTDSSWKPVIRFKNGIELDFSSNKIILTQPTEILSTETFKITTDKHLILTSGQKQVPGKPNGYPYGIWENTDLDEFGDPILDDYIPELLPKMKYNRKLEIKDGRLH